jgi:hypothetical protein
LQRKIELGAGKLVDGRPSPTMTCERDGRRAGVGFLCRIPLDIRRFLRIDKYTIGLRRHHALIDIEQSDGESNGARTTSCQRDCRSFSFAFIRRPE